MSKRVDVLSSARNVLAGVFGVLGCVLRFGWMLLQPKAVLAAKLLAAESQLAACVDAVNRKKAPRPRLTLSFRVLWIALSKWLWGWKKLARVMQPDTRVKPKYAVTDKGKQFDCHVFRKWCKRRKVKPRYGAVGKYGSIAVIERFNRTLKHEGLFLITIPFSREHIHQMRDQRAASGSIRGGYLSVSTIQMFLKRTGFFP